MKTTNNINSINNINTRNMFDSGLDQIIDPSDFVKKTKNMRRNNHSNRQNSRQKDYERMARDYYQGY